MFCFGCNSKIQLYKVPKESNEFTNLKKNSLNFVSQSLEIENKSSQINDQDILLSMTDKSLITIEEASWEAPSNWQEKPLDSLRKGNWIFTQSDSKKAEISIFAFPGNVGGNLANINRWRQQIMLTPINQEEYESLIESVYIGGYSGALIYLNNELNHDKAILGAIVRVNNHTWYFKMIGNKSAIDKQKPFFKDFLKTVYFKIKN